MKTRAQASGNLAGLEQAVSAAGLDAIVLATPENVRYGGDVALSTQRNIRHRPAFVVWHAGAEPVFVVAENEVGRVRRGSWIERTSTYREFGTSPMQALAAALGAQARIGCELDYMPFAQVEQLRALLPGTQVVACDELVRQVRRIKTPREIELLTRGAQATEQAILRTFAGAREGEDERRLMRRLSDELIGGGAERVHSAHIYGGPNAGGPHMGPTHRRLQRGDLVKADLCGVFDGYVTNVGRTAVVGAADPEVAQAFERLHALHHRLVERLRPGAIGRDLYAEAQRLYRDAGFELRHPNNGHAVGLEVHERPQIGPHEDLAFEPGMVVTVESRVRLSEVASLHLEDMVLVTLQGPTVLTAAWADASPFVIPANDS